MTAKDLEVQISQVYNLLKTYPLNSNELEEELCDLDGKVSFYRRLLNLFFEKSAFSISWC